MLVKWSTTELQSQPLFCFGFETGSPFVALNSQSFYFSFFSPGIRDMCPEHIFFSIVNKAIDIEIIAGKHFGLEQVITKKIKRGKKALPAKIFHVQRLRRWNLIFSVSFVINMDLAMQLQVQVLEKINLQLFFKSQRHVIAPWKLIFDVIQTGKPRMNAREHTGEMVSNSFKVGASERCFQFTVALDL